MSPDQCKSAASRLSSFVSPFFLSSACVLSSRSYGQSRSEVHRVVHATPEEMQLRLFPRSVNGTHSASSTNELLPVSAKITLSHLRCQYVNGVESIICQ